jgi:Flp pilus assembly protein TadD
MSQVARRYYERGVAALDVDDVQLAAEQLQAALDLAPAFGNARVAFAIALAKLGDCPRAAAVLRNGLQRASSPVSAAAMQATLGDVLTRGGDFFGAEEAFKQAAEIPGFEARAASGLARVYGRLGRYPDAVAELKKAAKLSGAKSSQ